MDESLTPEQEAELADMLAAYTARIEAATLELRKRAFWAQMERLEREEIAQLERWLRL